MQEGTHKFAGVHTALVTPMEGGQVCYADLEALVERQVVEGISGLVPVGTTGESPTLSHAEDGEVIRTVVQAVNGRVPVIAGTGSNATSETVDLTRQADQAGADAILQVAPYYNKPSQEGLFRHFAAVAEATEKPIILYSIPGRCGIEIAVETCARLYEAYPHVLGIKEAGGNCDRVALLRATLGPDYLILSGDDPLTLPFMSLGAQGVISVGSNLVVRDWVQMVRLAMNNDYADARQINDRYFALFRKLLSLAPNPVPIKHALWRAGHLRSAEVRSPLAALEPTLAAELDAALETAGLLETAGASAS